LLSFLAVLSQELGHEEQGSLLVAATPRARAYRTGKEAWREHLADRTMAAPELCMSHAGATGMASCGLADFMAGDTPFQAVTDIAGNALGGGAGLCELADTQEESLVQFYPEALALAFFAGGPTWALPVPLAVLGARRYVSDINGETGLGPPYQGQCGRIRERNWLNEKIMNVTTKVSIAGRNLRIAASAFVAVASKCTACEAYSKCSVEDMVNNACDVQRRLLNEDIAFWYQGYESSMYHVAVQVAFRAVVKRIGTGPWGAGEWRGDSQQSFLAVWLATSLINGPSLDYYVYSHFCENPGNQCFVLGKMGCEECIKGSMVEMVRAKSCGTKSIWDVIGYFQGRPTKEFYDHLSKVKPPPGQVFDLL